MVRYIYTFFYFFSVPAISNNIYWFYIAGLHKFLIFSWNLTWSLIVLYVLCGIYFLMLSSMFCDKHLNYFRRKGNKGQKRHIWHLIKIYITKKKINLILRYIRKNKNKVIIILFSFLFLTLVIRTSRVWLSFLAVEHIPNSYLPYIVFTLLSPYSCYLYNLFHLYFIERKTLEKENYNLFNDKVINSTNIVNLVINNVVLYIIINYYLYFLMIIMIGIIAIIFIIKEHHDQIFSKHCILNGETVQSGRLYAEGMLIPIIGFCFSWGEDIHIGFLNLNTEILEKLQDFTSNYSRVHTKTKRYVESSSATFKEGESIIQNVHILNNINSSRIHNTVLSHNENPLYEHMKMKTNLHSYFNFDDIMGTIWTTKHSNDTPYDNSLILDLVKKNNEKSSYIPSLYILQVSSASLNSVVEDIRQNYRIEKDCIPYNQPFNNILVFTGIEKFWSRNLFNEIITLGKIHRPSKSYIEVKKPILPKDPNDSFLWNKPYNQYSRAGDSKLLKDQTKYPPSIEITIQDYKELVRKHYEYELNNDTLYMSMYEGKFLDQQNFDVVSRLLADVRVLPYVNNPLPTRIDNFEFYTKNDETHFSFARYEHCKSRIKNIHENNMHRVRIEMLNKLKKVASDKNFSNDSTLYMIISRGVQVEFLEINRLRTAKSMNLSTIIDINNTFSFDQNKQFRMNKQIYNMMNPKDAQSVRTIMYYIAAPSTITKI